MPHESQTFATKESLEAPQLESCLDRPAQPSSSFPYLNRFHLAQTKLFMFNFFHWSLQSMVMSATCVHKWHLPLTRNRFGAILEIALKVFYDL